VAFLTAICIVLVAWVDYVEKPEEITYNVCANIKMCIMTNLQVEKIVSEEVEEIKKPDGDAFRNGSMLAA
jgi:hypothetical protein